MAEPRYVDQGATFDVARVYRYALWRVWQPELPRLGVVLLNPSTATETVLDPTLRRCIGFARAFGCGSLEVGNIFALRSTDPAALYTHPDPVGPDNDAHLLEIAGRATFGVIVGWGVHGARLRGKHGAANFSRGAEVEALLAPVTDLLCLGTTGAGDPRHPLYLPGDTRPMTWRRQRMAVANG